METRLPKHAYLRWDPTQLGYSLPVAEGMRKARLVGLLVLSGTLLLVALHWKTLLWPWVEPALPDGGGPAAVLAAIPDRRGGGLPVWDPGPDLVPVTKPELVVVKDAGFAENGLPGDPRDDIPVAVSEAKAYLADNDFAAARSVLRNALRSSPQSWALSYNLALVDLRTGNPVRARKRFTSARRLALERDRRFKDSADYFAARSATRYSLGLARLADPSSCEEGIVELKRAIGDMKRFVELDPGILAEDENDLFKIRGFDLDSYQIRNALVEGYLLCERYPEKYFEKRTWAESFQESEYKNPTHPDILAGPFTEELAGCVETENPGRRCWALSNLNALFLNSRPYLALDGGEPEVPSRLHDTVPSLVRMTYNMAVLVSETPPAETAPENDGGPRLGAVDFLEKAYLLNGSNSDPELQKRIEQFGRHLAVEAKDYRLMGMPYRGTPPEELSFRRDEGPEAVKGMAWTVKEYVERLLREGRPEAVSETLAAVRSRLQDPDDVASLDAWREEVEHRFQDELLDRLGTALEKDDLAGALAYRELEASYLGEGYARRAWGRWLTPGRLAGPALSLLLLLVVGAATVWVRRQVVLPYLIYTSRFYESEFHHRHERLKKDHIPFTADELAQDRLDARR